MKVELIAELVFNADVGIRINNFIKTLIDESLKEAGCLKYEAFRKGDSIIIVEAWVDDESLEQHKKRKHFTNFVNFIESNDVVLSISSVSSI